MKLSTTRPALAPADHDSGQPTIPGLEPDIVARFSTVTGSGQPVRVLRDQPVDAPAFASFDAALAGAHELLARERADARWGLFHHNPGRVLGLALLDAKDGVRLVRTDLAVDSYKEPVPGQMFPGQNWWVSPPDTAVRETPSVLALVGAEQLYDLRSGASVRVAPYRLTAG
jgi:hypothetical protein